MKPPFRDTVLKGESQKVLSLLKIVSSLDCSMRWVTLTQSQTERAAWTPVKNVFHLFTLNRCWLNIVQFNKYLWNVYFIHGTLRGNGGFPTSSMILIQANIQQPKRKLVRKYLFLKTAEGRGDTHSKDQISTSIPDEVEGWKKEILHFSGSVCLASGRNSLKLLQQNDPRRKTFPRWFMNLHSCFFFMTLFLCQERINESSMLLLCDRFLSLCG